MHFQRADLNAPEHDVLRIDVAGFQRWDTIGTKLFIAATCERDGDDVHTVLRTTTGYLDLRLPDAICKDMRYVLGLVLTDKLANKPSKGVRVVIHDFLSFAYLTRQIQPHTQAQRREWIAAAWAQARKCPVPVTFELGSPELKREFRDFLEAQAAESKVTATPESLGEELVRWQREQARLRGWKWQRKR